MVMVMDVGRRLRELRKSRRLNQGDLECRTGLLRFVAFFSKTGGPPPAELLLASENRRSRSKSKERFHSHTPAASLAAFRTSGPAVTRGTGSTAGKGKSNETARAGLSGHLNSYDLHECEALASRPPCGILF